jgi:hypothetical protein
MTSIAYTWGSTPAERAETFACDAWLADADLVLYRGVTIDAPPEVVFRWLCQLRIAPYSYDWIDNLGRRSPSTLTPGLDALATGQRVMTIFRLVAFEAGKHLTLELATRAARTFFGHIVVTYRVEPVASGTRLAVKMRVRQDGPRLVSGVRGRLLAWGDLLMMRKQLLTLKERAEHQA